MPDQLPISATDFALSAAFITFFVVIIRGAALHEAHIRETERREESMRDLDAAVATRGVPRELGTPLASPARRGQWLLNGLRA